MSEKAEHGGTGKYFPIPNVKLANYRDENEVVRYIHYILEEAVLRAASDIHFETYEDFYRIRFRQNGLLQVIATLPSNLSTRIAARIKILSNLDIAEKRLPQDGRFSLCFAERLIDFRVSSCPTFMGEKIVVRILDAACTQRPIETLGFTTEQQEIFLNAVQRPQGLILVTGPTGSGKTATLYSTLNYLNTYEKNIVTVEEPVEITLPGVNQVNTNIKCGLNFSDIVRSFLRQDPDIIMIGEIRDRETAKVAIQAAQTGHLVLSTLHTNNARDTVLRLLNLGIDPTNILTSLSLIIAQRLVRKLCNFCKKIRQDISLDYLVSLGSSEQEAKSVCLYQAVGCPQCIDGYHGRMGLFEIMAIDHSRTPWTYLQDATFGDFFHQQSKGILTLRQLALKKMYAGNTTLEEINRVIL